MFETIVPWVNCPAKLLWSAECILGECPVWNEQESCLYFLDIKGKSLLRWHEGEVGERYPLETETGAIALTRTNELVAAQRGGFARISFSPWKETPLPFPLSEPAGNRFNDGKCDPAGRFWAASMDDACRAPTGSIWSLSENGETRCHCTGFIVGNGFGWSKDHRTMYFTDSENRRILAYSFDLECGELGSCRQFAEIAPSDGYPDGLVLDDEDHVWSANWDGARITRYRPDGTIERVITMPVSRPTSLAFGGPRRETLFVTSARIGLSSAQLAEEPLSGALFALNTGFSGPELPRFGERLST